MLQEVPTRNILPSPGAGSTLSVRSAPSSSPCDHWPVWRSSSWIRLPGRVIFRVAVTGLEEVIVVVADQLGLDELEVFLQMVAVGEDGLVAGPDSGEVLRDADPGPCGLVGADAELLLGRVRGEEVDISEMRRVALTAVLPSLKKVGNRWKPSSIPSQS